MEIHIQDYPDYAIAEVSGEVNGKTAPDLEKALSPWRDNGTSLLLDMTRTTYMSSAGLRTLLLLHREASTRNKRLILVSVCQDIEDVMRITGFLRFFTLAKTVEEALLGLHEESRAVDAQQRSA